jgi:hypothetical protein
MAMVVMAIVVDGDGRDGDSGEWRHHLCRAVPCHMGPPQLGPFLAEVGPPVL